MWPPFLSASIRQPVSVRLRDWRQRSNASPCRVVPTWDLVAQGGSEGEAQESAS